MFLVNSRLGLVTETRFNAIQLVYRTYYGRPFFQRYGTNLPNSLRRVLPSALGFSPSLPVSVYGTVTYILVRDYFLAVWVLLLLLLS